MGRFFKSDGLITDYLSLYSLSFLDPARETLSDIKSMLLWRSSFELSLQALLVPFLLFSDSHSDPGIIG